VSAAGIVAAALIKPHCGLPNQGSPVIPRPKGTRFGVVTGRLKTNVIVCAMFPLAKIVAKSIQAPPHKLSLPFGIRNGILTLHPLVIY